MTTVVYWDTNTHLLQPFVLKVLLYKGVQYLKNIGSIYGTVYYNMSLLDENTCTHFFFSHLAIDKDKSN